LLLSRQNDLFTVHVFKCSSISVLFHVVSNGSTLGNEFCPSAAAVEASSIASMMDSTEMICTPLGFAIYTYINTICVCVYIYIPVVPRKAVAEVSKIGNL